VSDLEKIKNLRGMVGDAKDFYAIYARLMQDFKAHERFFTLFISLTPDEIRSQKAVRDLNGVTYCPIDLYIEVIDATAGADDKFWEPFSTTLDQYIEATEFKEFSRKIEYLRLKLLTTFKNAARSNLKKDLDNLRDQQKLFWQVQNMINYAGSEEGRIRSESAAVEQESLEERLKQHEKSPEEKKE